jgi:hypothetical protein
MRQELVDRFEQTKIDFNEAISGHWDRMDQAVEDMRFAFVRGAQWQGSDEKMYQNRPKFENNTTSIAIQRIHGQYQRMKFGVKIIPNSDESKEEDADLLTSKYRDDFIKSDGVEADSNASLEAFTCGFGATLWVNKYENEENPDPNKQYLCSEPIYSAASSVIFSANAIKKDKSDAKKGWLLVRMNRKAIEEEYGVKIATYPHVVGSALELPIDNTKDVYLAHVWEKTEKKVIDHIFSDGLVITTGDGIKDNIGNDVPREVFEELKSLDDFEVIKRKVCCVEYSFQHGDGYLIEPQKTPFKRIPIIPRYGYFCVINGVEYWWGEVAQKRDPQRFENMLYSALGQIAAQNQIGIKEYLPQQVARHARAHASKDVENPPYLLTDPATTEQGQEVIGPVAEHQPPQIGSGLQAAVQINSSIKQQHEGTGQSTLPANASAVAIQQVNERQDDRYQMLFQNSMYSIQAGAKVYIPACKQLYFSQPRNIRLLSIDGTFSMADTMQQDLSPDGLSYGPYKNAAQGDYEVQVQMDEAYKHKRAREHEEALKMLQYVDTQTPKGQMVLNQAILTTDSDASRDLKKLARMDNIDIMLSKGIQVKPENPEEEQYIQQKMQQMQQQAQQQDPQTQALIMQAQAEAQARQMEGQAAIQNEQNDAVKNQMDQQKLQMEAINDAVQNEIAAQKVENERARLQIEAQKAGADIHLKSAQALKTQAETATTLAKEHISSQPIRRPVEPPDLVIVEEIEEEPQPMNNEG